MSINQQVSSKKIFLFSPFRAPFIEYDVNILKNFSNVTYVSSSGFKALPKIIKNILTHNLVFCWFGSVYAAFAILISKLFFKRSVVIIGGVDAVALPEFDYGIWLNPKKSFFLKKTLPLADFILVVAPNLKENLKKFIKYRGENIYYLPTGYDTEKWRPGSEKEDFVLSIGACDSIKKFKKKGFDILVRSANLVPQVKIVIIGVKNFVLSQEHFEIPSNVQFIDYLPQEKLLDFYQKAKVFCQPSRSEGMPNTLCEAMSCACIPVGSSADGIPVAIGDTGYVVPVADSGALADALLSALKDSPEKGLKARQRIIDQFPVERRISGLKKIILNNEAPLEETS